MAVTNEQLLVQIGLDTTNASKSLDVLTKELIGLKSELSKVGKSTEKTSDVLSGFGGKMVALNSTIGVAKIAFQSIVNSIKPFIQEYANAQDETKKLTNMLQLFGDYTPDVVADFEKWADTLEQTTIANGGLSMTLATTAKSMGLSNDMAKKLVETAANLSAATGDSMEQSFQALTMTLKGNARALGESSILLSDLTEKELQAGKGVDRLAQIFDGQASAALNTFSGQMKYTANQLDKLMENIGGVISESFGLDSMASSVANTFKNMSKWIEENRSDIMVWGQTLKATFNGAVSFIIGVLSAMETAFKGVLGGILKGAQALGFVLNKVGITSDESYQLMKKNADNMLDSTIEAANATGEAFKDAYSSGGQVTEQIKKAVPVIKSAGAAFKGMGFGAREALKEVEGIIKDLEKRILDANKNIGTIGATEAQTIEAKRIAAQGELDIIERKLKDIDQLKGKQLELLRINRDLADKASSQELATLQKKNLDELVTKNQELYLNLNKDAMIQNDLIDSQTKLLLEQLDIKTRNMALDEAGKKALEDQQKLIEANAAAEKKKAGGAQYQALEQSGKNIASGVSEALKTGISGLISGFASMLNGVMAAIDAIAGVINTILDFIPKVLDTVTGILNKITDLPNIILNAFKNLGDAIVRLVREFIPNLLKAIPEIINGLIKSLAIELPKAMVELVKSIPGIILQVLKDLTSFIDELVVALITAMPEISVALIEAIIKDGPRIAMAIVKTISFELPKAIIKGMIDGAKRLLNMFKNIFGKGQKIQVDQKQIASVVKDLGKKLSGEAGKLFAVVDMEAAQKTAEKTAAIETAVTDGINKIKGVWQQLIDGLLAAWRWVYDNIILPIFNALKTAWLWVYDNIVMPLINGLTAVWQWVNDKIIQPILIGLQTVFQWVLDKILLPLATIVSTAFQWVVDHVLSPIANIVSGAFQWVVDKIINPLMTIGETAFKWVNENIVNPLKKIGAIFERFKLPEFKWPSLPEWKWPEIPTPGWIKDIQKATGGSGGGKPIEAKAADTVKKVFGFSSGGLVNPIYAQTGLMIPRGTDTVPAMLTPGEFVINRGAVNSLGTSAMNSINNGVAPVQNTTVNIELNIDTSEPVTEDFVRNRLMPRLRDELRRASLDGQFILSAKGVR